MSPTTAVWTSLWTTMTIPRCVVALGCGVAGRTSPHCAACTTASQFVVASHNERSVCYAVDLMAERGIPATGGGVYFGQLLGMCDNVSFALGAAGYEVFKYVPYGPVFEVVPYLTRRAEENAGVLGAAVKERAMIRQELRNRMRKAMNL